MFSYSGCSLLLGIFLIVIMSTSSVASSSSSSSSELDAFWAKAATTVSTGDFQTYASLYHPDAVLVVTVGNDKSTKPIQEALKGWKAGFDETAAGHQTVHLAFRFSQRLDGGGGSTTTTTTAHETGIFCYKARKKQQQQQQEKNTNNEEEITTVVYMHFESLLVKKNDQGWLWLMEYQKGIATEEEWKALAPNKSSS